MNKKIDEAMESVALTISIKLLKAWNYTVYWWGLIKQVPGLMIKEMKKEANLAMEELRETISLKWKNAWINAGFWWGMIKGVVKTAITDITGLSWEEVKAAFDKVWTDIADNFTEKIKGIKTVIEGLIKDIAKILGFKAPSFKSDKPDTVSGAQPKQFVGPPAPSTEAKKGFPLQRIISDIITPFAAGGIVTSPTLGLIGEAGSNEAVIPLNEAGLAPLINGITNAITQVLSQNNQGNNQQPIIELNIDGQQLAKATFKYNESERNRNSNSFVTVR